LHVLLALRAAAELDSGKYDAAFDDVNLSFRLIESLRPDPMVISQLTRMTMLQAVLQPIWEGVGSHRWTEPQLDYLQRELTAIDFLSDYVRNIGYECADRISLISSLGRGELPPLDYVLMFTVILGGEKEDTIRGTMPAAKSLQLYLRFSPSGWLRQGQIDIGRFYVERILPLVNAKDQRVYAHQFKHLEEESPKVTGSIRNYLVDCPEWTITNCGYHFAWAQTARNEALIACALERYRIRYGKYPDSTEALSPEFIQDIPHDVIDGNPLRYRRTADGQFLLYSIGWDEIDDGGAVDKQTHSWDRTGDWAWSYPLVESKSN